MAEDDTRVFKDVDDIILPPFDVFHFVFSIHLLEHFHELLVPDAVRIFDDFEDLLAQIRCSHFGFSLTFGLLIKFIHLFIYSWRGQYVNIYMFVRFYHHSISISNIYIPLPRFPTRKIYCSVGWPATPTSPSLSPPPLSLVPTT